MIIWINCYKKQSKEQQMIILIKFIINVFLKNKLWCIVLKLFILII